MNRFTRTPKRINTICRLISAALAASAVILGTWRVHADAIHGDRNHEDEAAHIAAMASRGAYRTWSEYLTGGPSVWSAVEHPPVTPSVEAAIWKAIRTDPGESSPWLKFMLWKQSIDPARFAFYHPKVSVALNRLSKTTTTQSQGEGPPTTSSSGGTSSPTEGQSITPIPEPGTWLVAIGLLGWGVLRFRRPRAGEQQGGSGNPPHGLSR